MLELTRDVTMCFADASTGVKGFRQRPCEEIWYKGSSSIGRTRISRDVPVSSTRQRALREYVAIREGRGPAIFRLREHIQRLRDSATLGGSRL